MPLKSLITAPHGGHGRTLRAWRRGRRGIAIVINGSAPLGQLEPLPAGARAGARAGAAASHARDAVITRPRAV